MLLCSDDLRSPITAVTGTIGSGSHMNNYHVHIEPVVSGKREEELEVLEQEPFVIIAQGRPWVGLLM